MVIDKIKVKNYKIFKEKIAYDLSKHHHIM